MTKNEIKTAEEIEKNRLGFFKVKQLKKNAKIVDLNNLATLILNFESVTKKALIRLLSNDVTYYLNQMEKNNEVKSLKITSTNSEGGDKVYFYNQFSKESQLNAEMISYFTYYLTINKIKYGKLTVNPITKALSVPFLIEKEDANYKIESEVYFLQSYDLNNFDFSQSFSKLPVFVVDELFSFETIGKKALNCILLYVENNGRNTEIQAIYREPNVKETVGDQLIFKNENITNCKPKYLSKLTTQYSIDNFKKPYAEAEKRAIDVKSRIYSKK